ncbi:MAG: phage Gp37/Gp68 family protein [Opitutaceae bacterium]
MEDSKIAWTNHTFNPWIGCTKISPGCAHCYAKAQQDDWLRKVEWGPDGTRLRTGPDTWAKPHEWNREAQRTGTRLRVFCSSLADVFEDRAELAPWRDEVHALIAETPQLDWQILTKRPEIAAEYYRTHSIPKNVWIGTSVEDRVRAEQRIPVLRPIPATVRFLSIEPLLEDLGDVDFTGIDWVIVGGESGRHFRTMHADWVRPIRDQCLAKGISFFFKQWAASHAGDNGHVLDGKEYRAFPR